MSIRRSFLLTFLFISSFPIFSDNSAKSELFAYLIQNKTSSFLVSEKGEILLEEEFEVQKKLKPQSLMFFNLLRHGFIENRRKNAKFFNELFGENEDIIIQKEVGISSWFGFSIILRNNLKNKRSEIIEKLSIANIETRPIVAGNFTKNPTIKYMDHTISGELKNSEYIDENGFFVGNDHRDLETKIALLHETLKNI